MPPQLSERRFLLYAALFSVLGIAWLLGACAVLNPSLPEPRPMTLHEYSLMSIKHSVRTADVVAMGDVTKVENDWRFDVRCHVPTQLMGCREQNAWHFEVAGVELWAFPPMGQYLPIANGMRAIFFAQRTFIVPVAKCDQMGEFTSTCYRTQGQVVEQVVDTLDILPMIDSALVDSLWKHIR